MTGFSGLATVHCIYWFEKTRKAKASMLDEHLKQSPRSAAPRSSPSFCCINHAMVYPKNPPGGIRLKRSQMEKHIKIKLAKANDVCKHHDTY